MIFKNGSRIFRNLITAFVWPKYIGTISQTITEAVGLFLSLHNLTTYILSLHNLTII